MSKLSEIKKRVETGDYIFIRPYYSEFEGEESFEDEVEWLINQTELAEQIEYINNRLQKENDSLCDKLADIRDLFDESDMKAEGHGMEDAIADPYAVACYAENKLKRLIQKVKDQQEELDAWREEGMI